MATHRIKKRGGQKGHEGHFRPKFAEDQIDEVIEHTLTHCPSCGTELEDADRAPCVVQQVKIVAKPVKIEEHRGLPYWCPTCQCFHYAPMPKEVEHGGLFDARRTAIVAYLKGVCHASYSTIRKFLRDVLGIRVARSYLKKILEKVSDSLESVNNELKTMGTTFYGTTLDGAFNLRKTNPRCAELSGILPDGILARYPTAKSGRRRRLWTPPPNLNDMPKTQRCASLHWLTNRYS